MNATKNPIGRPKKTVTNSPSSNYRKANELAKYDTKLLLMALLKAAERKGDADLQYICKAIYKNKDGQVSKIRNFLEGALKPKKLKCDEGLSFLLNNRFSKAQYTNTRLLAKGKEADIFPSYKKIAKTKLECRPPPECFDKSDVCVQLLLQALIDHTARRLLFLQEEVLTAYAAKKSAKKSPCCSN